MNFISLAHKLAVATSTFADMNNNAQLKPTSNVKLDTLPPNVLDLILYHLSPTLDLTTEWNTDAIAHQVLPLAPVCTAFCHAVLRRLQQIWAAYQREKKGCQALLDNKMNGTEDVNNLVFTAAQSALSLHIQQSNTMYQQTTNILPSLDKAHSYNCRMRTAWRLLNTYRGSALVLRDGDHSTCHPSERPCQLPVYSLIRPLIKKLILGPYGCTIGPNRTQIRINVAEALQAVARTVEHIRLDVPTFYMPLTTTTLKFPELKSLSLTIRGRETVEQELLQSLKILQFGSPELRKVYVEVQTTDQFREQWFDQLKRLDRKELLKFPWLQYLPSSVDTLHLTLDVIEEDFLLPCLPHVKHITVSLAMVNINSLMQLAEMKMFSSLETLHLDRCEFRFPPSDQFVFSDPVKRTVKRFDMCAGGSLDANGLTYLTKNCTQIEVFNARVEPEATARAAFGGLLKMATHLHSISSMKPFLDILKDEHPIAAETIIHSKSILQGFLGCRRDTDVDVRCIMITDFAITLSELTALLENIGGGIEVLMIELYSTNLQDKNRRHEQVDVNDIVKGLQEIRKRCPRLTDLSFGNLEKMSEVDDDLQYLHQNDDEDVPSALSIEFDLMEKTYPKFCRGLFLQGFIAAPPL